MEDILVPIFGFIFCFGAPAALVWLSISLRHEERRTIIERGLDPAQYKSLYARNASPSNPLNALRWALLFTFVGAGLWLGSWMVQVYQFPETTIAAMPILGGGVGLLLYYLAARKKTWHDQK